MSTIGDFIIHTDGGARGNPGPAAFAFIIERPGQPDMEEKGFLGEATNNIAEYTALVRALERAQTLGGKRLIIHSDSELMVRQMNGQYKVKNEGLLPLFRQARDLVDQFDHVDIRHVRREQNKRADQLCNEAMDNPRANSQPAKGKQEAPPAAVSLFDTQKQARAVGLAYLKVCAESWARGNPRDPDPEQALDQLWNIVKDAVR